jgi:hypothetical protein
VQQGRDIADATAVESLFSRVTGYNHRETAALDAAGESMRHAAD